MSKTISLLDRVRIASPCKSSWAEMSGDERVRYCSQCKLNVYNLSAMTRVEAEALIVEKEGKLCGRYYARADGTIITKDCPVGWRRAKKRIWWTISSAAAVFGVAATLLASSDKSAKMARYWRLRMLVPFKAIADRMDPPELNNFVTLGSVGVLPADMKLLGK